ncbi:nucleolar protein 14-like [Stegodyphus dumicola]|uniref:nucleolar protein 14-like n=1 Tax=Stegodyphus dumicola TaxID=202533 RepID=UPI0015ACFBF0|nr:nucleolar protein 14-like [Stegodyphus dumicola]
MAKKNWKKTTSNSANANPFNVKVNRKKHSVLGEKIKGTKGLPGISHAVGNAKRKELWYKTKAKAYKANRFLDKRLLDSSVPLDERATHRLVRERQKKLKKSIFNLNEDEDLTHEGVPIENFKKFDDYILGSEDEEQLDAAFVNRAHFGGFSSDAKNEPPKSHKEIIDQLIVESKQKKQERKIENEATADLTEKLDKDWKEMCLLMPGIKGKKQAAAPEKDDLYDRITRELKFEMKATPATRLKTSEEIAKEEQEKLQRLEKERLARMLDDSELENDKSQQHLSADSIYDGFDLQPITVAEIDHASSSHEDKKEDSENDFSENSSSESDDEQEDSNFANFEDSNTILDEVDHNNCEGIPSSLEEFQMFASCCSKNEISNIVESILKVNLPSKSEKKLIKLEYFFGIIIEYILQNCDDSINICGFLFPHLYTLAEASPSKTAEKLLNFLDHEQQLFQENKGQTKKNFPRLQTLIIFKICSVLYSVSDFRHPVITPAVIFMSDILSSKFCINARNIVIRLFISRIILNCIAQSKRLVPEALGFLNKLLTLAVHGKSENKTVAVKSLKCNLVLYEKLDLKKIEPLNLLHPFKKTCNNSEKISILFEVVQQLQQFATLYVHLPSYSELFSKTIQNCSKLPRDNYPDNLREAFATLCHNININSHKLLHLTFVNCKPKPLKLFEPAFDSKFSTIKDDISKKRKLIKRVSQKIRKEEKGLLREMRKDSKMIASEKLNEQLEADEERKRKVKQLYAELAVQEGECKKFKKKS